MAESIYQIKYNDKEYTLKLEFNICRKSYKLQLTLPDGSIVSKSVSDMNIILKRSLPKDIRDELNFPSIFGDYLSNWVYFEIQKYIRSKELKNE